LIDRCFPAAFFRRYATGVGALAVRRQSPVDGETIMSMSLREQLLAAGLGTKKQAKQAEQEERRVARSKELEEQRKADAQRAQAAKAARDAELNRQRQIAAERKERAAQIKQLIEEHRLPKLETDEYFNFIDRGKVRRMSVDAGLRERLMSATLMIVRFEGKYDVVPAEIAARIKERDERCIVRYDPTETRPDDNDPYKDFVVPDDLRW
jgi:uncharacterized protein